MGTGPSPAAASRVETCSSPQVPPLTPAAKATAKATAKAPLWKTWSPWKTWILRSFRSFRNFRGLCFSLRAGAAQRAGRAQKKN